MAGLTKKGKVYYAVFRINGKTKWEWIGAVSYKKAKEYIRKLESGTDREKLGLIDIKSITFKEFASLYLSYSRTNKSQGSWERDITSIKALGGYFGKLNLEYIDNEKIEHYKAARQGKGKSNRTINIELTCLSVMLKKAVEWHYLSSIPIIKKLTERKKPPRFLSQAEMESLLNAATPWMKFILIVLRNTGLRSKQLRELRLDHTDFDNDLLTVENTKSNDYYTIPMTEELKMALLYLKDNYISPLGKISPREKNQGDYYFCNPDGTVIGKFRNSFLKAVRRAGLENVSPHTLRHTFASHLVMSGVDLITVQQLLGHKDISTTAIYAHVNTEHKEKAIKKLPWGERKMKLVKL